MEKISQILFFLSISAYLSAQPVSLNPENPHYLLFRGKATVIISSSEHYGAVINPAFNFMQYLNTLQNEGMNYTRLFSGTYFEKEGSFGIEKNTLAPAFGKALIPWKRSNESGAVCGGNKFDLDKWDENYFIRLRTFVSEADKRGIIVEVSLFTSIYGFWDIQPWNPKNNITIREQINKDDVQTLNNGMVIKYQENFIRKIVKELNEFDNVIYEIQNEPWADHAVQVTIKSEYNSRQDFLQEGAEWRNKAEVADKASLDWQKRVAEFIVDQERQSGRMHLIAQNYSNFYFPVDEVDPNVSILNFHYAYPLVVELNYNYNKVIGFDESGFAGNADATYRKQAWNFILAGGGLFNNLDYSFAVEEENGEAVNNAPGGGSPELRKQLKVMSDFINSFSFVKMKPDRNSAIMASGCSVRVLSEPGKQYAVYINKGTKCNLKLNLPKGNYDSKWISTLDGRTLKTEKIMNPGGEILISSPDYSEDIALKITLQ